LVNTLDEDLLGLSYKFDHLSQKNPRKKSILRESSRKIKYFKGKSKFVQKHKSRRKY